MKIDLVRQEKTGDYEVRDEEKRLGVLYEKECHELGHCWVFSVETPGVFELGAYIYSSPESAKEWLPREIRDEKTEGELYDQASSEVY
ncbi:MAG: hypothetical protein PHN75_06115 [Syntrophales bacterium]|nr:hypothetical protein [Syntrophales bacterium]